MDGAQSSYSNFFTQLEGFVSQLKDALSSDAPSALQHVDVATQIIRPDDSAFSDYEIENVIKKVNLTTNFTTFILDKVGPFTNGDSQEWLSGQQSSVGFYITFVTMALATLKLESQSEIDEVSGGLSGINQGDFQGMDLDVLKKIKGIVDALS